MQEPGAVGHKPVEQSQTAPSSRRSEAISGEDEGKSEKGRKPHNRKPLEKGSREKSRDPGAEKPTKAKVTGDRDAISWLNKKISRQDEASAEQRLTGVGVKNDSVRSRGDSARHRNPSSVHDQTKKKDEQRSRTKEFKDIKEDRPGSDGQVSKHGKSGGYRNRSSAGKNRARGRRVPDTDQGRVQEQEKVIKQVGSAVSGSDKDEKSEEKMVEIGMNVNVIEGKYVRRDANVTSGSSYGSSNQPKNMNYMYGSHPLEMQYQGGVIDYSGMPYSGYSHPYGIQYDQHQGYHNHYQSYPPDQRNTSYNNYNYYPQYLPETQYNDMNYNTQRYNPPQSINKESCGEKFDNQKSQEKKEQASNDKPRYFPRKDYSSVKSKHPGSKTHRADGSHSMQAGMLTEQLLNESYECMVCCDKIGCRVDVWSCINCYHVFHLRCIRKWARSPTALVEGENAGWRCPACQNITQSVPNVYRCFCGKVIDPEWNVRDGITPHSCGELCKKKRDSSDCSHLCNQLCHPGPCPSCPVMVTKYCECGKTKQQIRCGQKTVIQCKEVCSKLLNCGVHSCERICHSGPCELCGVDQEQVCYCGNSKRQAVCGTGDIDTFEDKTAYFSCGDCCNRQQDCGNHVCSRVCHKGQCEPCKLTPSVVSSCPCGNTSLQEILGPEKQRKSCLDAIPTCDRICGKILPCSPDEGKEDASSLEHHCKQLCHHGNCGPCEGKSTIVCRCGSTSKEVHCSDKDANVYLCDQRCHKKRQCGRHRCDQKCCIDKHHKCELICGKKMRCGIHACDEPCHRGYCPPCFMTSFEELTCYCGSTVLYPPIQCGTPPPDCMKLCSRQHLCSHQVNHLCHNEDVCPPCTVLTKTMCNGNHELRFNMPCHVTDVSCGQQCGVSLPCGHRCNKLCHKLPCPNDHDTCTQPCEEPRKECGHPCGTPCHKGTACPSLSCKVKVIVTCKCGRRSENVPCLQGGDKSTVAQFYQRLTTETLANKMKDVQLGQTVDISMLDDKGTKTIECNEDCFRSQRDRRLAQALQIDEDAIEAAASFRILYSPFLVSEGKNNLTFVKSIEEAFENLIEIAPKTLSGQKSHSFPPMNQNQRRIIHELSVHYNCSSVSYDSEPKRNTVITATKESRIPPATLSSQISRQLNPPAPAPVPYLPSNPATKAKMLQGAKQEKKNKAWSQVPDYFADDFND